MMRKRLNPKISKALNPFNYLLLFFFIITGHIFAQSSLIVKDIKKADYENQIEDLRTKYGNNKVIPKEYELQFLIALSYYPELTNTHIVFKQKHIKTSMASRPAFSVLFQSKKNITYNVCINNSKKLKGALMQDISFNELIGLIGHELGHVTDYTNKNKWQLFTTAFRYIFVPKFKKNLEFQTDIITINHGLGWQIYDFVDYLFDKSTVSERYKKHKEKYYLTAKQILEIILKSPNYPCSSKNN